MLWPGSPALSTTPPHDKRSEGLSSNFVCYAYTSDISFQNLILVVFVESYICMLHINVMLCYVSIQNLILVVFENLMYVTYKSYVNKDILNCCIPSVALSLYSDQIMRGMISQMKRTSAP